MRLRLTLEYDGTRFRGWAAQPNLRTVEGVVRDALGWVYGSWERLSVAGRTDTGVHALGQVASVDVEGGPPVDRAVTLHKGAGIRYARGPKRPNRIERIRAVGPHGAALGDLRVDRARSIGIRLRAR